MASPSNDPQTQLIWILQNAHAGELAAAFAYQGHRWSLRRPDEKAELLAIEQAEWLHRAHVAVLLAELKAKPRWRREALMGSIGRVMGLGCFLSGWTAPMYMAGRLEAMNVGEYDRARQLAEMLGLEHFIERLEAMRVEEDRHERYFGEKVRGRFMVGPLRAVFGWVPPT